MKKLLLISLLLTGKFSFSQCGPLTTLYAGNNGQDGIMFDITALNSVVITGFDIDAYGLTHTYEIYYKVGTHVGFTTTPGAWTLLGTAANVPGNPRNSPTAIPITLNLPMCAGDTYGFYITSTGASGSISYTNGTAVGTVFSADANIQIKIGTGKDYPFAASFTPRTPNTTCYYNCAVSCCLPPTMSSNATTCSNTCNGTATATVGAGGVAPYTYQWDAAAGNQTTQTATGLCPGTYTVNVTDASGCVSSGTVTVAAGPAPANSTITPAGPFCLGSPATNLTAATGGGTWSGPGITNATNGTFNPATAGVGSHVITYTIGGACGSSDTETIVVNANANATINPAGPFCLGSPATNLTAATGGGTWSGTGITNASNGTFDPATAGVGNHVITYTISGACGSSDTETIVVNPNSNATINPAGPFCTGSAPVNLTAASPGGTWSGTGITNTSNGIFDPSVAGNGTHVITYTIAGACGSSDTENIVVNASMSSAITPAGPFCESSSSVNLTAASPGGTWSGNGITNATNGTFDPSVALNGTHTITYSISGACGSTSTEDIVVLADADATITPSGPYCDSDPAVNLVAAQSGGVWSGTGITNTTNGTFDPSVAGSGLWLITHTISGQCGDTDTEEFLVNQQMDATINPVGPFCENDPALNLLGADPGGLWSGNGITNANNGTFNPNSAGPGSHTITYTIAGACGDVQTTVIDINPNMDASITQAGPFCIGNSAVNLTAADPGGTWTGNGITDANAGTFDPAIAGIGTTTITYSIGGMCGDAQSIDILVNANDDASITSVSPFCENAASLQLAAADPGGTWSGTGITNVNNGTFDPAVAGPGNHTITYTIPGACGDTQSTTIQVNALPIVSFSADVTSGCEPLAVTFTNTTIGSSSCMWNFSSAGSSTNCGTVNMMFPSGVYDVSLTTTDANGCTATQTNAAYINSYANPVADFTYGPQPATAINPTINFSNSSSGGATYVWNFSGIGSASTSNPSFMFPGAGSYPVTLYVTSANGCVDSVSYVVQIDEEFILYVPNAFTADDNGNNDVFLPIISGIEPDSYQFYVFNRWGEVVFSTTNPTAGWDGTYRGRKADQGVYAWRILVKADGSVAIKEFIGHVTLLR